MRSEPPRKGSSEVREGTWPKFYSMLSQSDHTEPPSPHHQQNWLFCFPSSQKQIPANLATSLGASDSNMSYWWHLHFLPEKRETNVAATPISESELWKASSCWQPLTSSFLGTFTSKHNETKNVLLNSPSTSLGVVMQLFFFFKALAGFMTQLGTTMRLKCDEEEVSNSKLQSTGPQGPGCSGCSALNFEITPS